MAISVLIFLFFSIYILTKNYRRFHTWWLFNASVSLSITTLSLLVYISKYVSYYSIVPTRDIYSNLILFTDYQIWMWLFNFPIGAFNLTRIIHIGAAGFIYSVVGFSIIYTTKKITKNTIALLILLAVLPLILIFFYEPFVSFKLFVLVNNANQHFIRPGFILNVISGLHKFNYVWINLYFLFAVYLLYMEFQRSKISIKRRQILFYMTEIISISVLFLFIFVWMPIKEVNIYRYLIRLSFIPVGFRVPYYYFAYMPVLVSVFIGLNIYFVVRFQILHSMKKNQQKLQKKSMYSANQNARALFHAFKNYFFTIKILSDSLANQNLSQEDRMRTAEEISGLCNEYIKRINVLHTRLKDIHISLVRSNIVELIKAVVNEMNNRENIRLKYTYESNEMMSRIDEFHFVEAIKNILVNATEAIQLKNTAGTISINLQKADEWCVLQIRDNGIGISREDIKKIFKPFYTTKNTANNWGVGLSYTHSIIAAHGGFINVSSEKGKGTAFEIILPVEKGV